MQDFTDKRIPELVESIKGDRPGSDIAVTCPGTVLRAKTTPSKTCGSFSNSQAKASDLVPGRSSVARRWPRKFMKIPIVNVGLSDQIGATVSDGVLTVATRCADAQAGTPGRPEIERVVTASL